MSNTKSIPEAQAPEMVARLAQAVYETMPAGDRGWTDAPAYTVARCFQIAWAVMKAMVEPTADMVETGEAGIAANLGAANVWRGMMTAALDG